MVPIIIGISGNMGSGKTTLAKALTKSLTATSLAWDDFDDISTGPDDLIAWYKQGENYQAWDFPALENVLKILKSGNSIIHPVFNNKLIPTQYLIFDAPLGYLHEQTGKYIDLNIHIDCPLDVSLARWLIRDFKETNKTKQELIKELEFYLSDSRPLFMDEKLKSNADFIIDGLLSVDQQIAQ